MSDDSDETLALRAGQGCRVSFSALCERHYDRIYRLSWRWCGSRSGAEDIAQDVCIKLARAIANYRGEASFTTWLHRITYTTALDHIRSNQRMIAVEPSEIISLIDAGNRHTAPDTTSDDDLWTAVRSLPGQQRDAVLLVYGEDMSHAEAARVMECSEKTVSWHIHAAKKRLKVLLEAMA